MNKFLLAISAIVLSASAAYADAYPAYTKDKSAWWVSSIFLAPVTGLDAIGHAIELSGKGQGVFEPLHKATEGIAKNAAEGPCTVPVYGKICK